MVLPYDICHYIDLRSFNEAKTGAAAGLSKYKDIVMNAAHIYIFIYMFDQISTVLF